jgi:nucleolar protein 4
MAEFLCFFSVHCAFTFHQRTFHRKPNMSTLGKRKGRKETSEHDEETSQADETPRGSTLFVSNLPYTATSTDLQTLFSDFAPVRTAFVVTEHGTGVSKGVGYVSFAAREDAQSVWQQAQTDGVKMNGRGIRVAWAENKVRVRSLAIFYRFWGSIML